MTRINNEEQVNTNQNDNNYNIFNANYEQENIETNEMRNSSASQSQFSHTFLDENCLNIPTSSLLEIINGAKHNDPEILNSLVNNDDILNVNYNSTELDAAKTLQYLSQLSLQENNALNSVPELSNGNKRKRDLQSDKKLLKKQRRWFSEKDAIEMLEPKLNEMIKGGKFFLNNDLSDALYSLAASHSPAASKKSIRKIGLIHVNKGDQDPSLYTGFRCINRTKYNEFIREKFKKEPLELASKEYEIQLEANEGNKQKQKEVKRNLIWRKLERNQLQWADTNASANDLSNQSNEALQATISSEKHRFFAPKLGEEKAQPNEKENNFSMI